MLESWGLSAGGNAGGYNKYYVPGIVIENVQHSWLFSKIPKKTRGLTFVEVVVSRKLLT